MNLEISWYINGPWDPWILFNFANTLAAIFLVIRRSGGMSNELNNILSIHTDGVYEGVAIGGDRYPGSTFVDHLLRYQV